MRRMRHSRSAHLRCAVSILRPVALVALLAAPAQAAVICVPNDAIDGSCTAGQAQLTVQAAINAAVTAVDTVRVGAGSYSENLTLGKDITLLGAQVNVDACGRLATEAVITAASGDLLTLTTGSAGAEINGFHFSGAARGIVSTSGPINLVEIRNNRFSGFTSSAVFLNDSGTDITVDQNEIHGGAKTSGGGSFHLDTDAFDGFHFTNNCVGNGVLGGGFFSDGNRNVGLSTRAPLFDGNLFENHLAGSGVNIGSRSVEDATFSNNIFRSNAFDGLQGGPLRTTFSGNTFQSNGRSGLVMTSFGNQTAGRGSSFVTITQNCFVSNGLTQTSGGGIRFSAQPESQATNVFNNNDFTGNTPGADNSDADTIDGTNNYWGAASGPSGDGAGSGDAVSGLLGGGAITFIAFATTPQTPEGTLCNPIVPVELLDFEVE